MIVETIIGGVVTGAYYVASMAAVTGVFTALGMGGAWLIERRIPCNPYAVFPCTCPSKEELPGG